MGWRTWLVGLVLVGCGQLGFDPVDGAIADGGPDVATGPLAFDQTLIVTNTDEVEFAGRCTGSDDVVFSGVSTARAPCEAERFTIRVASSEEARHSLVAQQGGTRAEAEWIRDVSSPLIDDAIVPLTSATRVVPVRVVARDELDRVEALCFDWQNDDPEPSCFVDLGAAPLGPPAPMIDVGPGFTPRLQRILQRVSGRLDRDDRRRSAHRADS